MKKLLIFAKNNCPTCVKLIEEIKESPLNYEVLYSNKNNMEIFQKFNIMVAPTTILLKDDIEIDRFYGTKKLDFIEKFFKEE